MPQSIRGIYFLSLPQGYREPFISWAMPESSPFRLSTESVRIPDTMFYHVATIEAVTGEILHDAYQSTASYIYAASKTIVALAPPQNLNVVVK